MNWELLINKNTTQIFFIWDQKSYLFLKHWLGQLEIGTLRLWRVPGSSPGTFWQTIRMSEIQNSDSFSHNLNVSSSCVTLLA